MEADTAGSSRLEADLTDAEAEPGKSRIACYSGESQHKVGKLWLFFYGNI